MKDLEYSKFKDAKPTDTIHNIRTILHGLGIMTIDEWVDSGIEGCHSMRVSIAGTTMGSNGKGTHPVYALASGYAELMERMQNNILYLGGRSQEYIDLHDFMVAPDERVLHYQDPAYLDNDVMKYFMSQLEARDLEDIRNLQVHTLDSRPDHFVTLPFFSVKKNRTDYLSYDLYTAIYGSNGMCAGNTPEEALVQGISELFERYVNKKLIEDRITPPTVPDDYLAAFPGLYRMIQEIRRSGRYKVIVKDCSLGGKYPVVGTIILDTQKGTFGFKLGVHPKFQIALERTLTEAFQGRRIEEFTASCTIQYADDALYHRDNALNIMKLGAGAYPPELLAEDPSCALEPMDDQELNTNKEMLKKMVGILTDQGYDLLVRDVSYLGFPSFHLIAPGFSELYPVDKVRIREIKTFVKIAKQVDNFPNVTNEDLERLVRYLKFKRFSMLENQLNMILGRPWIKPFVGGDQQAQFLQGVCEYQLGRYLDASAQFSRVAAYHAAQNSQEANYYRCIADYTKAKAAGCSQKDLEQQISVLYSDDVAERVCGQMETPEQAVARFYPSFRCWNCSDCQARAHCSYPETEQVLRTIKGRHAENPMDQTALSELFQGWNPSGAGYDKPQ